MSTINEEIVNILDIPTWYRVVRPGQEVDRRPVFVLHGGPGMDHRTVRSIAALANRGRSVIHYDQVGSGRSGSPKSARDWSMQLFVDQLDGLRSYLSYSEVHFVGHSWGGMLALSYALRFPERVASLTLHSAIASLSHCLQARTKWNWPDPDDAEARQRFDEEFCCRIVPWPEELRVAVREMNLEVGKVMWSQSEIHPRGVLADWDIRARLRDIVIPTLICAGKFDAYAPGQGALLKEGIRNSKLVVFEQSAHYAHLEEPALFLDTVDEFLRGS